MKKYLLLGIFAAAWCALLWSIPDAVTAGVTPSSMTSLRAPTPVLNGPILSGRILNIGETQIATAAAPFVSPGQQRPVGSFMYVAGGATAYVKTGSAATAWEKIVQGTVSGGARTGGLTARALSLLGTAATSVFTCTHDDFINTPATPIYTTTSAGSGAYTVSATTTNIGGMTDVSSGATAASLAILSTPALVMPRTDTGVYYFASRFAVITAVDVQAKAVMTIGDGAFAPRIGFGICGSVSTTNFTTFYDGAAAVCGGTTASSPVSFSVGVQHVVEIWNDGTANKFHVAVDGSEIAGSPFTQGAATTISQRAAVAVQNGTTAAARTLEIDWWHVCWNET